MLYWWALVLVCGSLVGGFICFAALVYCLRVVAFLLVVMCAGVWVLLLLG